MFNNIRGFRDIFGPSCNKMNFIRSVSENILKNYGYSGIELPILEYTPVFTRSLGEVSDVVNKEMYTFLDRNEESLTLRPEGTAGLVRAFITNKMQPPQKLYYYGPMFRYERPQKGRYRQFYQLGTEFLGSLHPYTDAESIILATEIIKSIGIDGFTLQLNSLGDLEDHKNYNEILKAFLKDHKEKLSKDSQERLEKNPLRILDSKNEEDQKIIENAPRMGDHLSQKSKDYFKQVCEFLDNFDISYELDQKLVRGLDYYTHTTFEFKHSSLGAQDTFLAGGRYNGLIGQMGGQDTPGIGWALGVDRVALLQDDQKFETKIEIVVIPFEESCVPYAMKICQLLRQSHSVEISFHGKIGKDLKCAEKYGAKFSILIGVDELKENMATIKPMIHEQENVREGVRENIRENVKVPYNHIAAYIKEKILPHEIGNK